MTAYQWSVLSCKASQKQTRRRAKREFHEVRIAAEGLLP